MDQYVEKLSQIECFLMDMDGTLYLEDTLLPGAKAMIDLLDARQVPYYILTNNSSRSRLEYADKLARMGLDIPQEKIFTSGEATAIYLENTFLGASLYVVGTPSLMAEFTRHGFVLREEDPDVVVLGFDTTLTYDKLWKLCNWVTAGKPYIATHPDINCPTEDGFKPDIGAMIAFVATSTGREPDVIVGKPNAPIVNALAEKTQIPIQHHCMIGDRLYTDIALGRWGLTTALVLSGETKLEDLVKSEYQPDLILRDMAEMAALYRNVR